MLDSGEHTIFAIAEVLGVACSMVYRALGRSGPSAPVAMTEPKG